jgi:hypothetical protein
MRLAYGHREVLLLTLVALALAGLGTRLFATELFRALVSRNLLLVAGFNAGLSAGFLSAALVARRCWRWSRRAAVRFTALVEDREPSRRL